MNPVGAALIAELDREMAITRRVLERVPLDEGLGDWRPHPRSMSLAELAAHVAGLLAYARNLLDAPGYDLERAAGPRETFGTRAALLTAFDDNGARARLALAVKTDADLLTHWKLSRGKEELFTAPRVLVVRRYLFNHLVHHRGQLSVYLRLLDRPLPPIYGPTADESL